MDEGLGKGHTPDEWIGERVRGMTESGEEFVGTLSGVTEHGIVLEEIRRTGAGVSGSETWGPGYYGWRIMLWLYPQDFQRDEKA